MHEFGLGTEPARSFSSISTERLDIKLLEQQTKALGAIAAQLRAIPTAEFGGLPLELQPEYALATRRLLDERG